MCLAVPGKVVQIDRSASPAMGKVSFGGIQKEVCLEWLPDVEVGEYVIVHVGFAISKMEEKEALETLRLLEEVAEGFDELRDDNPEEEHNPDSGPGGQTQGD